MAHHEAVAGMGEGRRVVTSFGAIVHAQSLVATVHNIVKDRLVAALHVDGLEHENVHRILNAAALVARRSCEIHNAFVVLRVGIDLAVGFAGEFFIATGDAELMVLNEGLALFDDDLGDPGGGGRWWCPSGPA